LARLRPASPGFARLAGARRRAGAWPSCRECAGNVWNAVRRRPGSPGRAGTSPYPLIARGACPPSSPGPASQPSPKMRIWLHGFRCHGDARAQFKRGVTALVGESGCGKTTLGVVGLCWVLFGSEGKGPLRATKVAGPDGPGTVGAVQVTLDDGQRVTFLRAKAKSGAPDPPRWLPDVGPYNLGRNSGVVEAAWVEGEPVDFGEVREAVFGNQEGFTSCCLVGQKLEAGALDPDRLSETMGGVLLPTDEAKEYKRAADARDKEARDAYKAAKAAAEVARATLAAHAENLPEVGGEGEEALAEALAGARGCGWEGDLKGSAAWALAKAADLRQAHARAVKGGEEREAAARRATELRVAEREAREGRVATQEALARLLREAGAAPADGGEGAAIDAGAARHALEEDAARLRAAVGTGVAEARAAMAEEARLAAEWRRLGGAGEVPAVASALDAGGREFAAAEAAARREAEGAAASALRASWGAWAREVRATSAREAAEASLAGKAWAAARALHTGSARAREGAGARLAPLLAERARLRGSEPPEPERGPLVVGRPLSCPHCAEPCYLTESGAALVAEAVTREAADRLEAARRQAGAARKGWLAALAAAEAAVREAERVLDAPQPPDPGPAPADYEAPPLPLPPGGPSERPLLGAAEGVAERLLGVAKRYSALGVTPEVRASWSYVAEYARVAEKLASHAPIPAIPPDLAAACRAALAEDAGAGAALSRAARARAAAETCLASLPLPPPAAGPGGGGSSLAAAAPVLREGERAAECARRHRRAARAAASADDAESSALRAHKVAKRASQVLRSAQEAYIAHHLSELTNSINAIMAPLFDTPIYYALEYSEAKGAVPSLRYGGRNVTARDLSGGELDRVSLALVVALAKRRDSPVAVFDETLASLDEARREEAVTIASQHLPGRCIIFITHDPPPGLFDQMVDLGRRK
jgi:hypothetical protein